MMLRRFAPVLILLVTCGEKSVERPRLEALELPTRSEISATLSELSFDAFIERSFEELLRRSPETVTRLGLSERFGVDNQHLNNVSLDFRAETAAIQGDILDRLNGYSTEALTEEQRLIAATYRWWLDDQRTLASFAEHVYLLQPSFRGVHSGLQLFMTGVHPFRNRKDVEDYVIRLWRIEDVINQAIARIRASASAGIIPARAIVDATRNQLNSFASLDPELTPYYGTLAQKARLVGVDDDALFSEGRDAIRFSVLPAYRRLASLATELSTRAPTAVGVAEHPNGNAYYAATLRHHTTTDMSGADINVLGRSEIGRINGRVREIFANLGYPSDAPLAANYNRAATDSGTIGSSSVQRTYLDLINDATTRSAELFRRLPAAPVDVVLVDSGGYYIGPSLDGARAGAFYASRGSQPLLTMPTLAYHEAIPGHHLQIAIASELTDLPLFQRIAGFTGYIEGWGLYAETLAAEGNWFASEVTELGYLQFQAFRAARLVVDTGIHRGRMTYSEAVQYFIDNVGFSRPAAEGQIFRYMSWPGQATAYMVGQLELLALREAERGRLGDSFDIRDFHDVVLNRGALPLEILRSRFDQ